MVNSLAYAPPSATQVPLQVTLVDGNPAAGTATGSEHYSVPFPERHCCTCTPEPTGTLPSEPSLVPALVV